MGARAPRPLVGGKGASLNGARSIPAKVRLAIPMLGSEDDGTALSACRGIGRLLASAGCDWHDLAQNITVAADPAAPTPTFRDFEGWKRAWASKPPRSHFTPKQERSQREQATYCRLHDHGRLSPRERAFIRNISAQPHGLTIRQGDWLAAICDRLEQEDRARCQ